MKAEAKLIIYINEQLKISNVKNDDGNDEKEKIKSKKIWREMD